MMRARSSQGAESNLQLRETASALVQEAQHRICAALEAIDGKATFQRDLWSRQQNSSAKGERVGIGSGGGLTCILQNGLVFEKAGVNVSEVAGTLPKTMSKTMVGREEDLPFFACGVSLVIHPASPLVPTTHANYRYIEVADRAWFGGGADLTPYVLFAEDAEHFHQVHKDVCDRHDREFYPRFKKNCDEYFFLPHRQETRGIGGIFFDYMGRENPEQLGLMLALVTDLAPAFLDSYLPIVERRKNLPYTEAQKHFQLLRRGRYVEFNLLYDRGTQFGLQTGGRVESILMSLPLEVRWEYSPQVLPNSPEQALLDVLSNPREWVS